MPDRFYVPGVWQERIELEGTEAHHLAHVLRANPGDAVEIFDGRGLSAHAEVIEVKKRSVSLKVTSATESFSRRGPELILAVASPKGDRLQWMIEKMTELGVDRFIPLKTRRSVVDPSDQKLIKLKQTVIAACKQSHRSILMEIDEPCPLSQLIDRLGNRPRQLVWGEANPGAYSAFPSPPQPEQRVAVIGPEGGFTEEEKSLLISWDGTPISLSPFILRVETAAISFATYLQQPRLA